MSLNLVCTLLLIVKSILLQCQHSLHDIFYIPGQ